MRKMDNLQSHSSNNKQKLILPLNQTKHTRCKLICFPYAGGNASMFKSWQKELPLDVELLALHAPGRASRIFDEAYTSMSSLVEDLLCEALPLLQSPYIIFGHSLGARVAYEFINQAIKLGFDAPIHFIASGSRSPDTPCFSEPTFNLPTDEFIKTLKNMEGTPSELLENKELMDLLLPALRADFQIAEEYIGEVSKLPCPLSVLGGDKDLNIEVEQLNKWNNFTSNKFELTIFEGGHFFINEPEKPLKKIINIINSI